MINYFDKKLFQSIYNSNEFKNWLISKRWFGDKSILSNLEFDISIVYFNILEEKIILSVIKIITGEYSKKYFLPLILYGNIEEILDPTENKKDNIIKLTENTFSFSKKVAITTKDDQKIISVNLLEAEFCLYFWKKMLFNSKISELFPSLSLELKLY